MRNFASKCISVFLAGLLLILPFASATVAVAQTATTSTSTELSTTQDQKAALEAQLAALQAQVAADQKQLASQKQYSGTLTGDIKVLTAQITAKEASIAAKSAQIASLTSSISDKKNQIQTLSETVDSQKESLAQLLRETNEMDQTTLTSFLLSSDSLSDFYSDESRYTTLKSQVKASVDSIEQIEGVTQNTEQQLEQQQNQTIDEEHDLETAQKSIEADKTTQNQLLSASKTKEASYQTIIAQEQAKVAQINAALFALAGGSKAIPFSVALQYANAAQAKTGINPAFLLAELTQESNLGANVGKCYISDTTSGAGVSTTGKTFPNVMKASRDIPPFLQITTALGMDPLHTVVSCPIAGVAGYGGAMGPAQFIPSTWALFIPRLQKDLGEQTPNPWAAQDAFMAAALYLTDLGAVGSSYTAEMKAACKYYGTGGSSCSYGTSVLKLTDSIQSNIDYLNEYGTSKQ